MFRDDATYPATFDRQRKAEVAPELRDTDVLLTFREKIEKVRFVPEAEVANCNLCEASENSSKWIKLWLEKPAR